MILPKVLRRNGTSQVMYYDLKPDGSARIFEEYTIKDKWMKHNEIGTWSNHSGITIRTINIWDRRGNLTDITLYNTILNYWPVTVVVKNEQGDVVDSNGYLPNLLFNLRSMIY